jgi:hypothetical protein
MRVTHVFSRGIFLLLGLRCQAARGTTIETMPAHISLDLCWEFEKAYAEGGESPDAQARRVW